MTTDTIITEATNIMAQIENTPKEKIAAEILESRLDKLANAVPRTSLPSGQDALDVFEKTENAYALLSYAALYLTALYKSAGFPETFEVQDTWLDYGANWMYTTLIAHNDTIKPSVLSHWQAFSPKEQENLFEAGFEECGTFCKTYIKTHKNI